MKAPVAAEPQRAHAALSNGRYCVQLTTAGTGTSSLGPWALTRRSEEGGWCFYIRDLDSMQFWSAGHLPVRRAPARYDARLGNTVATVIRDDEYIETRMDVRVDPDRSLEWRRLTLTNTGDHPRRIEVTTCVEVALNTPAADAAHPAFSKLFLETSVIEPLGALQCRRRPRSPEDTALYLVHAMVANGAPPLEYETDRARFLGRGRTLASPAALLGTTPLSGTVGPVLDPVFSLRHRLSLEPGQIVHLDAVLAAGTDEALIHREVTEALQEAATDVVLGVAVNDAPLAPFERDPEGSHRPAPGVDAVSDDREPLLFFNGTGGFSEAGDEYVIRMRRSAEGLALPPQPWTNVVTNPRLGFVASERGLGFTWYGNSREYRLTPWSNDPVADPAGEALYVRDEDAGLYWSPLPGPVPGSGSYETRHGFGYTTWRHTSHDLAQEVVCFVEQDGPVKVIRLRITNRSDRPRRLSAFFYAEWVLGALRENTAATLVTEGAATHAMVLARSPAGAPYGGVAFAALAGPPEENARCTADREAFLGRWGSTADPRALREAEFPSGGAGLDPCAAFSLTRTVAAGDTAEWLFLLGHADSRDAAIQTVDRYRDPGSSDRELDRVKEFWSDTLGGVRVETPSRALDLLVNGWLSYQNLSCRLWARSAFFQSGGAFGFRDQLQDAAALIYLDPARTREQILLHAAHQFVEGDVLHWWHPPSGQGIRTKFSDDLLWLPYIAGFYVDSTGDSAVLDQPVRFVAGPGLEPDQDEALMTPRDSGESATVFEHCCRAIDRSLSRGAHGLPLMGSGDWNDGMNRVGREGRGESVWLGFFLHTVLQRFVSLCESRADTIRAERYRAYGADLSAALNDAGWDGQWYRRAYYDDGTPLGSKQGTEARIDAIAQAWAVLSGVAPLDRAHSALDAAEAHLIDESSGLIRLLTPPFDRTPHDPGYIKGYLPGVRENGGQYTHGALWVIRALAEAGRGERAALLLEMLTPIRHTDSPEAVRNYQVEPYVVAADVYAVAPHVGRGGWTWYTGSAGWMYRVALETILGMTIRAGCAIVLRPCIPTAWRELRIRYRLPDRRTVYDIAVRRARGETSTVTGAHARVEDGALILPLVSDLAIHRIEIELGTDVGPRYRPSAMESGP
jgi:cyclic beta-1,2-glucan synthetase